MCLCFFQIVSESVATRAHTTKQGKAAAIVHDAHFRALSQGQAEGQAETERKAQGRHEEAKLQAKQYHEDAEKAARGRHDEQMSGLSILQRGQNEGSQGLMTGLGMLADKLGVAPSVPAAHVPVAAGFFPTHSNHQPHVGSDRAAAAATTTTAPPPTGRISCPICDKVYVSTNKFQQHHKKSNPTKCPLRSRVDHLINHLITNDGPLVPVDTVLLKVVVDELKEMNEAERKKHATEAQYNQLQSKQQLHS